MIDRWKESLRQDAEKAVANLFSGRAGLGSSLRREIPEILFHEFPNTPEHADDRERLDTALLAWLNGMRTNYQCEVSRLGFDIYSKRLCDALRALQLLDLPRSIQQIREVHPAWLRWLAPLRLAPERDPALESWRLLSQRQEEGANPAPWLQLARDGRPEYLSVALVGLQRPEATKKQQVLMVAGLLHHSAQASNNVDSNLANFDRQLAALRGRYPRGPAHWKEVLDTALIGQEGHPLAEASVQLRQKIIEVASKKTTAKVNPVRNVVCPTKAKNAEVLFAIKDSRHDTTDATRKYLELVEAYLHFTIQTGDAYFFVRTLRNHGNHLLQRPHLSAEALAQIGQLIEEALRWSPNDEYTWTFWADWCAYQGQQTHQEWVLRELVRLFPNNEIGRVELARLLINGGKSHWPEAEYWLREAAERNPEKEPCRVELARLLIRIGEQYWPEAEEWLRAVIALHPENGHSHNELARLLTRTGRRSLGIALLEQFQRRYPGNAAVTSNLEQLVNGIAISATEDAHEDHAAVSPSGAATGAVAPERKILANIAWRSQLQQDYMAAQADTDALQRLHAAAAQGEALAGFYFQWLKPDTNDLSPPPHAWAWQAARCVARSGTNTAWDALQRQFPEHWEATRFVRWLTHPDSQAGELELEIANRMARYERPDELDAIQRFVLSTWQRLQNTRPEDSAKHRKDSTFAILHAKAEPSLVY